MASINDTTQRTTNAWFGNVLQIIIIGLLGWVLHETVETGRVISTTTAVVTDVRDQVKDHEVRIRVLEREPRK